MIKQLVMYYVLDYIIEYNYYIILLIKDNYIL